MNPDDFLRAFHAAQPGVTPRAVAGGRLEGGGSSYDLLARLAGPGEDVLDLGCGDGFLLERLAMGAQPRRLVGLVMWAAELEAARARPALAEVELIEGRAQALPLADASFDRVLSHLAFMLMSDIDQVVAEIARVLRPGGRFAAVTGGGPGPDGGDGFALFLELFRDFYAAAAPVPRLGDRRARHRDGLAELMNPDTGFEPGIEESCHTLRLDGPPEAVWAALAASYEMYALDREQAAAFRRRFLSAARELAGPGGAVPCAMRLRLLRATRAQCRGSDANASGGRPGARRPRRRRCARRWDR